jgi:hypothetical protein
MEIDLKRKKEFMLFFQKLQEQKDSFYTKEQLVKLKTYEALLFDCFLWKYRDSYLKLFVSFLNYNISGEEFSKQLINMRSNHIVEFNELMKQLQHDNRIKNKFKLVTKSGKVQETNKLVPLKIGQSKSIRFYEVL